MSKIKGPWKFIMVEAEYEFYDVVDQSGAVVLKKGNYDEYSEASVAQGHLIAAAPELLDALKHLLSDYNILVRNNDSCEIISKKLISEASKAIAKAEGES